MEEIRLARVRAAANCQRTCSLSQQCHPLALVYRFTHNGVRVSESVDVDYMFLKTVGAAGVADLLTFWCRELHAGRQPGPHGYEMPVERDGRTDIAYIPVAERV